MITAFVLTDKAVMIPESLERAPANHTKELQLQLNRRYLGYRSNWCVFLVCCSHGWLHAHSVKIFLLLESKLIADNNRLEVFLKTGRLRTRSRNTFLINKGTVFCVAEFRSMETNEKWEGEAGGSMAAFSLLITAERLSLIVSPTSTDRDSNRGVRFYFPS